MAIASGSPGPERPTGEDDLPRSATLAEGGVRKPAPAGGVGADAYDRMRRRILWSMPAGLYLLGSRSGSRRNLMTLNWASQVALDPKILAVSVEVNALTHDLVAAGGVFAISILSRESKVAARKFAKPAVDDPASGTLSGFSVIEAPSGAPVLADALAWLDCKVTGRLDCGSHSLFLGEVTACAEVGGADQPVLRMEDTRMNYGG